MDKAQNDKTKKLVNDLKSLVEGGEEGTLKEIAAKLDYNYSALNQIYNGGRNAPKHLLRKFAEVYNTQQSDWRDEQIELYKEQIAMLKEQNQFLRLQMEKQEEKLTAIEKSLNVAMTNQRVIASVNEAYQEYWIEHLPSNDRSQEDIRRIIASKAAQSLKRLQTEGIG